MFTDEELAYLESQRIGRLATSQPDGTLQNNPVGFGVNKELGTIDIGGYNMARSRKFRNVAANGRAGFVVDDVYSTDPWRVRFLEIRGHAEAITEPARRVRPDGRQPDHPPPPDAHPQHRARARRPGRRAAPRQASQPHRPLSADDVGSAPIRAD